MLDWLLDSLKVAVSCIVRLRVGLAKKESCKHDSRVGRFDSETSTSTLKSVTNNLLVPFAQNLLKMKVNS